MQQIPLLEKLGWIFTNADWTTTFPNTIVTPLSRITLYHIPMVVQVDTHVPKGMPFRFEEFWPDFNGFQEVVDLA